MSLWFKAYRVLGLVLAKGFLGLWGLGFGV